MVHAVFPIDFLVVFVFVLALFGQAPVPHADSNVFLILDFVHFLLHLFGNELIVLFSFSVYARLQRSLLERLRTRILHIIRMLTLKESYIDLLLNKVLLCSLVRPRGSLVLHLSATFGILYRVVAASPDAFFRFAVGESVVASVYNTLVSFVFLE